jgi:hypothetical protein
MSKYIFVPSSNLIYEARIPMSISSGVMGFKILYPQGTWMDVTTDIGMAVDYFMDFDGMTHTLTGVSQMIK